MSHSTIVGVFVLLLVACGGAPVVLTGGEGVPPDAPAAIFDPPEAAAPDAGDPQADAGPAADDAAPGLDAYAPDASECNATHPQGCPVYTSQNGCRVMVCDPGPDGGQRCTTTQCAGGDTCVQQTEYKQAQNGGIVWRTLSCLGRQYLATDNCNTYCTTQQQAGCCVATDY